jgi:hypothetical protein
MTLPPLPLTAFAAEAGIHSLAARAPEPWAPAFAGDAGMVDA